MLILPLLISSIFAVTTVINDLQTVEIVSISNKDMILSYNFEVDAPNHISSLYLSCDEYATCNATINNCNYFAEASCEDHRICNISMIKLPYTGVLVFYNPDNLFARVDYQLELSYDTPNPSPVIHHDDDDDDNIELLCTINDTLMIIIIILFLCCTSICIISLAGFSIYNIYKLKHRNYEVINDITNPEFKPDNDNETPSFQSDY